MEDFNKKEHWEKIYTTKQLNEVSWYQPQPTTSLNYIKENNLSLNSKIIDVGGGDSFFVDYLLESGFTNITVLDISEAAIQKVKERLGDVKSKLVKWIVSDISQFKPTEQYDFWHDRAAFHFLSSEIEINHYINLVANSVSKNGFFVIGTFSEQGPAKCSGIEIKQYSEEKLTQIFQNNFILKTCEIVDHQTPFNTFQNFIFCNFQKK